MLYFGICDVYVYYIFEFLISRKAYPILLLIYVLSIYYCLFSLLLSVLLCCGCVILCLYIYAFRLFWFCFCSILFDMDPFAKH